VLEPFDLVWLRSAGESLFGRAELPAYDLAAARSVVAVGADFLETWLSPVELSRGFAAGRGRVGDARTRLTWIGPRLSSTGAAADRWLAVRPGGERALALGLLRWLTDPSNRVPDLAAEARAIFESAAGVEPSAVAQASGIPWDRIAELGGELAHRRPSALLGPGVAAAGADGTELAIAVQLINYVLGNIGRTVLYGQDPLIDPPSSFADVQALVRDLAAGKVDVLFVHHADLVGTLPTALGATSAMGKVPLVVSFTDRPDRTSELAHLILPDHHTLESLGDISPRRGIVALSQPTMKPIADTRSASQVLLEVAGKLSAPAAHFPFPDFYEYTQTRAQSYAMLELGAGGDLIAEHRRALERGGYYSEVKPESVTLRAGAITRPSPLPSAGANSPTLVAFPTALRGSGGKIAPWLREIPDLLSGVAWSTWVELSPASAKRMGAKDGDLLELHTSAGGVRLPLSIYPGLRDDAVAVPLGDADVLTLLPVAIDSRSGGLALAGVTVTLTRTGERLDLPRADGGPTLSSGGLLRTVSATAPAIAREPLGPTMTPEPVHPGRRWAMAIDLDRCSGCQACVVACYAENNLPVMGPRAIADSRSMAWLQIQRYVEHAGDQLRVDLLPMLCQQCSSAPCETVCPVYATYHTAEGLNAQVYNRCVGTRYCANNCPYKVRVFNWRDPSFPVPLDWQLNPDVSVRSKGVMEKCTFCVQRIRAAENDARRAGKPLGDGDVTPACVQTCPTHALVFGDANDPHSAVSALRRDGRGYRLLEELNTQPAVTYLARVREDEP
jgi:molybdopterin-containing oxidoreductase family iron-sulfur binding subunit